MRQEEGSPTPPEADRLAPGLRGRHLQLMAVGGAIGVGLFLGAGNAIQTAGPAVILCYLLAGGVVFLILRALGEMVLAHPATGSFASYAGSFVAPWAGYATGWAYWMMWTTTVMAEVTAVGIYVQYFFAGVPQWLPALVAVLILVAANLLSVRIFGEVEFWFALIKIVAIALFVSLGLAIVLLGIGALGDDASFSNLTSHGGFFPEGVVGPLLALQIVTYAFLGVEMIGVAAGETREPRRTLPRAINGIGVRILLFYVASIVVILALVPWNQVAGESVSPFVLAWEGVGIPAAAGILNGVVLAAALSSSNSGVFATSRMLYALAEARQAPRRLHRLNRRRVPAPALLVSGAVLLLGVVVNVVVPEHAFEYITSIATVAVLWTWAMILIAHLRFRARAPARGEFAMPGSPWTNWIGLAYVALVAVLLAFEGQQRVALAAGAVAAIALAVGWIALRRRRGAETAAPEPSGAAVSERR